MSTKVLVNDATPIDVLQMAVLAAAHDPPSSPARIDGAFFRLEGSRRAIIVGAARVGPSSSSTRCHFASDIAEGEMGPRHAIYCIGLLHACLQTSC
jgi:hypothetical protein